MADCPERNHRKRGRLLLLGGVALIALMRHKRRMALAAASGWDEGAEDDMAPWQRSFAPFAGRRGFAGGSWMHGRGHAGRHPFGPAFWHGHRGMEELTEL